MSRPTAHGVNPHPRSKGPCCDALFLQLPSPPGRDVLRDYAGGFGVSLPATRPRYGHSGATQPVLDLVYAATLSKARGLEVSFLDAQASNLDEEQLLEEIRALAPNTVVANVSLPCLSSDLRLLEGAKSVSGCRVIAFGAACSAIPDANIQAGNVDHAITHLSDAAVPDLLLGAAPGDGCARTGQAHEVPGAVARGHREANLEDAAMASLPTPVFDLMPMRRYRTWEFGLSRRLFGREFGPPSRYFPLFFSQGCPGACHYCPYPATRGRSYAHRPVERLVEDFSQLARAGTRKVILRDQAIYHDLDALSELCEWLARAGTGVQWLCEASVGSLPKRVLALMSRAGCVRIHLGIETGDERLFATTAKRRADYDSIGESLRDVRAAGMVASAHFLIGFPEETWGSISATLRMIEDLRIDQGDCAILTPYPGTPLFSRCVREGRVAATSWEEFTGVDPVLHLDHLSGIELLLARESVLGAIASGQRRSLRGRAKSVLAAVRGNNGLDSGRWMEAVGRAQRCSTLSSAVDKRGARFDFTLASTGSPR